MAFTRSWFFTAVEVVMTGDDKPVPTGELALVATGYWSQTAAVPPATDPTPAGPLSAGPFRIVLQKSTWAILLPAWQGQGDPQQAIAAAHANEAAAVAPVGDETTEQAQSRQARAALRNITAFFETTRIGIKNPTSMFAALGAALAAP